MPVYAYQCTSCGTAIEVRQSFTDDALTVCETCGGALRKRFDAVGVTFKGSGFYRTDSRASSASSGPPSSGASSSGSSGKDPATSGSKTPSSTTGGSTSSS